MLNKSIVINTSPLLALIAAWGNLERLRNLYHQILVPFEVCMEIQHGGKSGFGVIEFESADFLDKQTTPLEIFPFLRNSLDRGEAAVIQLALQRNINTVCIDETAGRRIARLNELKLTGSIGILLRAWQEQDDFSVPKAIDRMQARGIRLSETVIHFALQQIQKN